MNKYVIDGLLTEARSGRRVLVATGSMVAARCAFQEAAHAIRNEDARAYRSNGRERVTFPSGGEITFRSTRSNLRGMSADTVFLDWEALGPDEFRLHQEIKPIVASSPTGQIVRA